MAVSRAVGMRASATGRHYPDSVETRASWVAAALAIAILSISYGAPLDRRDRAEADRRGTRQRPIGRGIGRRAGLGRDRHRRHPDGLGRRPGRGSAHGDLRRADDRTRACRVGDRPRLGALSRPCAADRLSRRRRALSAIADLYQPLVRPPPRHGVGVDLVRPVHCRGDLAVGFSSAPSGGSAGRRRWSVSPSSCVLIVPLAMLLPAPRRRAPRGSGSAAVFRGATALRLPSRHGAAAVVRGVVSVLRADGDAVEPSRRVLQRSRHLAGAGCGDAVGAARLRFCQPAVLGLACRPDRRARHGIGRLGLPGIGDRRLLGDPERGRVVRGFGRLWARLQRHHPGLCRGDPRAVPVIRGVMAGADPVVHRHVGDGVRQLVCRRAL